ncbi:hypothetical protein Cycma_3607 [Cyclobacterium marinum DSM 745]|uniref:Uncharacterized protein n=1 Tax=Cyclobacterium marinum (strain ATCC 25205 / DSM 745 / LMG 13164 / NCIMB 1802) TaxID=880070 RepID=G0J063_CYCMS|nr:hypothetical protein Cycma_3607 [Cyclobacterium marinum DSM 745]
MVYRSHRGGVVIDGLYLCLIDSFEKHINNAIGEPYEGKSRSLPAFYRMRFDGGGANGLLLIIIFIRINKVSYQALLYAVSL